jgi:hypothetical protein
LKKRFEEAIPQYKGDVTLPEHTSADMKALFTNWFIEPKPNKSRWPGLQLAEIIALIETLSKLLSGPDWQTMSHGERKSQVWHSVFWAVEDSRTKWKKTQQRAK